MVMVHPLQPALQSQAGNRTCGVATQHIAIVQVVESTGVTLNTICRLQALTARATVTLLSDAAARLDVLPWERLQPEALAMLAELARVVHYAAT